MNSEDNKTFNKINWRTNSKRKQSRFKYKMIAFIKNNKAITFLSICLVTVVIWFSIKMLVNERNFNTENIRLKNQYENTIDSLQINYLGFATNVFSWSVRSELLRKNTENLNQLVTVFVQESGAELVQIINPEDTIVLISSDKKFEGAKFSSLLNVELHNSTIVDENGIVKIITPVMGFNSMIGIVIVQIRKNNNWL